MFFYIGEACPLKSLSEVEPGVYLDQGWRGCMVNDKVAWYKGYSTECTVSDSVSAILNGYQPVGKWCVISDKKVHHPVFRGFPLYRKGNGVANVQVNGYHYVKYVLPDRNHTQDEITLDEAATQIGDILLENTQNFFKFNKIAQMNLLFTCGLDSMTSWAVLDHVTKEYTLEVYLPKGNDNTFHKFHGVIREKQSDLIDFMAYHWGYNLTSDRLEENWHMTGFYAERIQLREADHLNAIANYYGKNIKTITKPTDYLHWFCQRPATDAYLSTSLEFADERELKEFCIASVYPDYQMWHLDNNFHFSPFFDIRITDVAARLSVKDILENGLNGLIQREIIRRFRPDFLQLLSPFKNEGDIFGNFRRNFQNIELDPAVQVNIR